MPPAVPVPGAVPASPPQMQPRTQPLALDAHQFAPVTDAQAKQQASGGNLLWNPWFLGLLMLAYAVIANLPCLIVQRYNRARLLRLIPPGAIPPVDVSEPDRSIVDRQ